MRPLSEMTRAEKFQVVRRTLSLTAKFSDDTVAKDNADATLAFLEEAIQEAEGEIVRLREALRRQIRREHDYQGLCPDEGQPDSRDPECALCRELMEVQPGDSGHGETR